MGCRRYMTVGEQPSFYIYPKHFSAVWLKLKRLCDVAGPGQIYSVSARFNPDWLKVAPIWAYAGSGELDAKTLNDPCGVDPKQNLKSTV